MKMTSQQRLRCVVAVLTSLVVAANATAAGGPGSDQVRVAATMSTYSQTTAHFRREGLPGNPRNAFDRKLISIHCSRFAAVFREAQVWVCSRRYTTGFEERDCAAFVHGSFLTSDDVTGMPCAPLFPATGPRYASVDQLAARLEQGGFRCVLQRQTVYLGNYCDRGQARVWMQGFRKPDTTTDWLRSYTFRNGSDARFYAVGPTSIVRGWDDGTLHLAAQLTGGVFVNGDRYKTLAERRLERSLRRRERRYPRPGGGRFDGVTCSPEGELAGVGTSYYCDIYYRNYDAPECLAPHGQALIACGSSIDCLPFWRPLRGAKLRTYTQPDFRWRLTVPASLYLFSCSFENGTTGYEQTTISSFNTLAAWLLDPRRYPPGGIALDITAPVGLPPGLQRLSPPAPLPLTLALFHRHTYRRATELTAEFSLHDTNYIASLWIGKNATRTDRRELLRVLHSLHPARRHHD